jgi:hypothetical protein
VRARLVERGYRDLIDETYSKEDAVGQITIPRWFIKQTMLRHGYRLPTKPVQTLKANLGVTKFEYVGAPRGGVSKETYKTSLGNFLSRNGSRKINDYNSVKNQNGESFNSSDFRYWSCYIGTEGFAVNVVCRCCGCMRIKGEDRKAHQQISGCAGKLVEAYKLLNLDKKCIVCDEPTRNQEWGIPICGETCKRGWCFFSVQQAALKDALMLVEKRKIDAAVR